MVPETKVPEPESDVFIAFSQSDQAWAEWITDILRDVGKSVATARDVIEPGEPIERSLTKAIGTARELFLVASLRALESPWVRAELALAQAAGKPVTAVVVDESVRLPTDLSAARIVYLTDSSLTADRQRFVEVLERPSARPAHTHEPIESRPVELPATFVDRGHELELLREAFLRGHSSPPATVVVTGPAGIGKTALAAMFVHRHEHDFPAVQWLELQRNPFAVNRPQIEPGGSEEPGLLIVDDADDYESIAEILSSAGSSHVLVLSRAHRWGRPFQVVELGPLDSAAARELVRRVLPNLDPTDATRIAQAIGGTPALLKMAAEMARTRSPSEFLDAMQTFEKLARAAKRERRGYYYLDTDDPRMISSFERAIEEVLGADPAPVEFVDRHRGSWRGWWRRRYTTDRVDAITDRAERAAEVAVLTKPEGEANRDNAEAIARLIEASASIPNMVVICSSVLLIKVTDSNGQRLVSKTLTATELRRFEEREELLANPVQALEFLQASEGDDSALPAG